MAGHGDFDTTSGDTEPDISSVRQTEFDVFSFSDQTEVEEIRSRYTSTTVSHQPFERSIDTMTDTCVSQFDDQSVVEEVFGKKTKTTGQLS